MTWDSMTPNMLQMILDAIYKLHSVAPEDEQNKPARLFHSLLWHHFNTIIDSSNQYTWRRPPPPLHRNSIESMTIHFTAPPWSWPQRQCVRFTLAYSETKNTIAARKAPTSPRATRSGILSTNWSVTIAD